MNRISQKICTVSLSLAMVLGILPNIQTTDFVNAASSDILLNNCELSDLSSGWKFNGNYGADGTNFIQGLSSFAISTNPVDNQAVMRRNEVTSPLGLDIGDISKKEVQFWLKISNISNIAEMQVELGTAIDSNEYNWSLPYLASNGFIKQNVWTKVILPIAQASVIGAPDNANINCFGIYFVTTQGNVLTFNVDNIKIVESTDVIINSCEASDITSGYQILNNPGGANGTNPHCVADKIVGGSSIMLSSNIAGNPAYMRFDTAKSPNINIGAVPYKKALQFWVKFNDINNISFLKIELGIAYDTNEYQWFLQSLSAKGFLVSGQWVKVTLPIAEANWFGAVDPSAIKNFGFLAYPKAGTTIEFNIDDVRVVNLPVNATGIINNCDSYDGSNWFVQSVSPNVADTTDKKEGAASLSFNFIAPATYVFQTQPNRINLFDLGDISNKEVELWFYINDKARINYVALELSSGGSNDVNEYQWSIGSENLVSGWNKLRLQFAAASITGTPDASSINWVRAFYDINSASESSQTIVKFDNIRVVQKSIIALSGSSLNVNRNVCAVSGISASLTGTALASQLDSHGDALSVVDDQGQQVTVGTVGTGKKVLLKNASQQIIDSLDVIVYGDISGDGAINVTDLAAVKQHIININRLSGVYKTSADIYKTGVISVSDLLAIKKHIINQQLIVQG